MKKIGKVFIISGILVACYFLFEPVFQYPLGWKELPLRQDEKAHIVHTDDTLKVYDEMLESFFEKMDNPSVSIAIGYKGEVYWNNAIGYSDITKKEKATLETQYRIGSTSKTITSTGLGLLIDTDKINLTDTVGDLELEVPLELEKLTITQLASHTSGLRNYKTCFCFPIWEILSNDEYTTVNEALSVFKDDDLLFEPGSDFSYSSYNYTLLSAAMEKAAGQEFTAYMQENIFNALGMTHTQAETKTMDQGNLATFYDLEESSYKESYFVNNSNKWAGGGFISTPSDLLRMSNKLMISDFITPQTKKLLWTPVKLSNATVNSQNYALGWRSGMTEKVSEKSTPIIHHAGTANGATSVLILFPEYEISISILTNKTGSTRDLFEIADAYTHQLISQE